MAILAVFVLAIASLAMLLFFYPLVLLTGVSERADPLSFDIQTLGINDLSTIEFWSANEDEVLWSLYVGEAEVGHLVFGEVPDKAVQIFPKAGAAPLMPKGNVTVYVGVSYSFDSLFPPAASSASIFFGFEIQDDRSVRYLGRVHGVWWPGKRAEPKSVVDARMQLLQRD